MTDSSSSGSSRISTTSVQRIINNLLNQQLRASTKQTYLSVWRQFNRFLVQLDSMPDGWEYRTTLFIGFLIDRGMQSSTIKSYVSAIKKTLIIDKYEWKDDKILLTSLTRACKLKNDVVYTRLPIQCGFLELILFEIQRMFLAKKQWYLENLYKALFILGYYGLMRVGELTYSQHVLKARDVHIAKNKDKMLLVLYSSKTHDASNKPQKIKITSNKSEASGCYKNRNFCLFNVVRSYIKLRQPYVETSEQFFIHRDGQPVLAEQARKIPREAISVIGLDSKLYDMHSLHIGRTTDLIKYGNSIDEMKRLGRWRSNVVYKYIR